MAIPLQFCPPRGGPCRSPVARGLFALTLLTYLAVGCASGDDTDAAPTVTASASPTVPSTTAPPTTVSSTVNSVASTTTPTTAPPTTIDNSPETPAEDDVREGFDEVVSSWRACLDALPDCDPESLAESRTGEQLEENRRRVQSFIDAGYRIGETDTIVYEIESIDVVSDGQVALVAVCVTDGSVIYLPDPTGGDDRQIINDSFVSSREVFQMELLDGRWVAASNVVTEEEVEGEENNRCA